MTEETKIENTEVVAEATTNETKEVSADTKGRTPFKGRGGKNDRGGKGRGKGGPRGGRERVKPEFESKTLDVRRVTRVVSGGRRFTFSVATVVGDRKGSVGFGMGKAVDTSLAMDKAYKQAVKKMITLKLNKHNSIPHEISAKFNASKINLMPNKGRGLIAGSSARVVLTLAGVSNITAKYHSGSKNKLNNARVTMKALSFIGTPFVRKPRTDKPFEKGDFKKSFRGRGEGKAGLGARGPKKNFFVKKKETSAPVAPAAAQSEA